MDETLGKRIVTGRKRLGMTQDQLAERLGVTAQAVSKWENDQSCPDITMLPKLAEIFSCSVDALLGCEPPKQEKVYEAELVPSKEDGDTESDRQNNWEFRWDGGRKSSVGMAVWVLLVGGLLLASNFYGWGASFWSLLWPTGLLVFGLFSLFPRFSFFHLGCTLFGAYFLLSNLGIGNVTFGKAYILPVFLLLFGLSLLADALRKPKKGTFTLRHNGKNISKHRVNLVTEDEAFHADLAFGDEHYHVVLPRLSEGTANVSFGDLVVNLSECEELAENCHIEANCSFGELVFLVPRRYQVNAASSTSFASFEMEGHPDPNPAGCISLNASVSFGEITVRYI